MKIFDTTCILSFSLFLAILLSSSIALYGQTPCMISVDSDGDGMADEITTNVYGSCVLPVELLFFKGVASENGIQLNWQTVSEQDNEGFEIERSLNGKNWKQIDFVAGNGTTIETQDYTFMHKAPAENINYYRLKQVDFDGIYEYSKVLSLNYESEIKNDQLVTFPNPIADVLNYQVTDIEQVKSVQLFDVFGRLVGTATQIDGQIDLASLSSGTYVLVVETNQNSLQQLVVKQ